MDFNRSTDSHFIVPSGSKYGLLIHVNSYSTLMAFMRRSRRRRRGMMKRKGSKKRNSEVTLMKYLLFHYIDNQGLYI